MDKNVGCRVVDSGKWQSAPFHFEYLFVGMAP